MLSPSYPTANHWYAEFLMTMGRHEEAIARIKNAQETDPLSLIINVAVGWTLYHARRYDEAIEQFRKTLELEPNYPITHWILSLVYREMARYQLAIIEGEKAVSLSGGSPLIRAALAHTYAAGNKTEESIVVLDELTNLATEKYVSPYFLAGIYAGLGERDRILKLLEKAVEEKSHWLIYLHIDPSMEIVHDDPRFEDLLCRVGLPPETNQ